MNWLAHLRLAPAEPLLRLGNLAGDFVRGVDVGTLHPDLQRGVSQHREIDRFVDDHPIFRRSRERFAEPFRRYAGVALDVFFDHYLARDWRRHGDGRELAVFAGEVHQQLHGHRELLPPDLRELTERIASDQWLTMYATVDGIDRVLRAMARRRRRQSPLAAISAELHRHYDAFDRDFVALWPELLQFARRLHAT